jgi:hypothetical protein
MLRKNTSLTETVKNLTERVEALTIEVHRSVVHGGRADGQGITSAPSQAQG